MNDPQNVVALDSATLAKMLEGDTLPANVADMGAGEPEVDGGDADTSVEGIRRYPIEVWSKACFQCDAFNPNGKYSGVDSECHCSNGNPNCPAALYTVTLLGPRMRALTALQRCRDEHGNSPIFFRFLAEQTEKLSEADQDWVMAELGIA